MRACQQNRSATPLGAAGLGCSSLQWAALARTNQGSRTELAGLQPWTPALLLGLWGGLGGERASAVQQYYLHAFSLSCHVPFNVAMYLCCAVMYCSVTMPLYYAWCASYVAHWAEHRFLKDY